jgi:hypothetical protein
MTEDALREALDALGISADQWRLIALLPLVEVAWADEHVQEAERDLILTVAAEHGVLSSGWHLLEQWLTERPSQAFLDRARRLLVLLADRHRGIGSDAPVGLLGDLRVRCEEVASAAGGLLGLAWTIDPRERAALDAIRRALAAPPSLLPFPDDLPRPPGGWTDLEEP